MITVRLEAYSWIAASLGKSESGRYLFRQKIKAGAVLADLFKELAEAYPEFRSQVYNPDQGNLNKKFMVIVNHKLVQESEFARTVLNDNDGISLSPILVGG